MVQALPSNIGIQQVTLKVADLDKMVNFYTKTIGLKLFKTRRGTCLASATRHQRCNSCLKRTNSWGRKSGDHWLVPYCFPATNPQRFRQYVAVAFAGKCANWRSRSWL
ncbi:Predicted ring-cleavage extradiol dioxygenase [Enterococcus faecalis]|nr:Predicted ring-cleavage extradiol dioxygenase [Enterococcus faecalis]